MCSDVRLTAYDLESFSVKEIAAAWHVSEKHVRRLIDRDELRSIRIGRAVRVPASAVAEFMGKEVN